jgi:hypothetical protein
MKCSGKYVGLDVHQSTTLAHGAAGQREDHRPGLALSRGRRSANSQPPQG